MSKTATIVYVSPYAASHSALNFVRPDEFIPERWLGEDPAFDGDHRDASQPFSLGPQNCIGKNLAWHEMRLMVCKLLWHFDFKYTKEEKAWTDQKAFIAWEKRPLMVEVKVRER
ncbi:cytochrome P450 CYP4/CYP19/CYP26 subfamily protein [Aspergillus ellipticus CBS 707.79]|uniref:Cytochrome P450 CYP4/CYP19/CYP26 subfamily protein n=1 Tax=Aspergillus ellipticus CBS 707.79 TaxID=1448320 RepID=A0A319DGN0_9EURO|nr:cytochrome P450 CYP4/CYP19/CYP26 subfamily protein [Aspergillus ellipticus CBS 707.79]